jgi:FtsH-binding integral membrane protein
MTERCARFEHFVSAPGAGFAETCAVMSSIALEGFRPAIAADDAERATFIRRTYGHLALAILAFIVLESWLLSLPIAEKFTEFAFNKFVWLGILAAYMGIAAVAENWAMSGGSKAAQYGGLGLYVAAEACLFVPLLTMARIVSPEIIPTAAILTGVLAGGLTLVCFATRANFSGLRSFLCISGFVALGLILSSAIFGFGLGLLFSAGMIIIAGAAILYSTSKVLHEFDTRQHVAASLALFAAIALLFWYIVRILIQIYLRAQSR